MNWWLAGLIAGVVAYLADWVMWSKVFTKGMEAFGTFENVQARMPGMMAKSAVLALVFGELLSFIYVQFMPDLWAGPGVLGGMELASVLWLPTIALATIGGGVWYDKARPLLMAQFWAWFVRMNAAGAVVGVLVK
ncbi:MAG: hypothetical protein HYS40_04395 [Gemmatimonadetes bacterium]|nr:hypothetical protein [Gemmatimonadota bacterium]